VLVFPGAQEVQAVALGDVANFLAGQLLSSFVFDVFQQFVFQPTATKLQLIITHKANFFIST
jgi:hypothetical protein